MSTGEQYDISPILPAKEWEAIKTTMGGKVEARIAHHLAALARILGKPVGVVVHPGDPQPFPQIEAPHV